jgi:hypothetical protein
MTLPPGLIRPGGHESADAWIATHSQRPEVQALIARAARGEQLSPEERDVDSRGTIEGRIQFLRVTRNGLHLSEA